MKRNFIFKFSLVALILTLITMPLVSGTYAKYVTQADGNAKARVAKWGVGIELYEIKMFGKEYYGQGVTNANQVRPEKNLEDQNSYNSISVRSQTTDYVVAPGTEGYIEFTLSGMPEVAAKLKLDPGFDMGEPNNWEVETKDYQPLNFAFKIEVDNGEYKYVKPSGGNSASLVDAPYYFKYDDITDVLSYLNEHAKIKPNEDVAGALLNLFGGNLTATGKHVFEWIWPYQYEAGKNYVRWTDMEDVVGGKLNLVKTGGEWDANQLVEIYDYADTVLGDKPEADLPTIKIDYSISITQID